MNELRELYQQTIIEHSRKPRNFGERPEADFIKEGFNPLCGDRVKVFVSEKNGCIDDIHFHGTGCAISMASASLMTEVVKGKDLMQIHEIFDHFHHLVMGAKEPIDTDLLGKLIILTGVKEFPMRVKCATLAWHALISAFQLITFTDSAEKHIKQILRQQASALGFRLSIKKMGCSGYGYVPELINQLVPGDIAFRTDQERLRIFIDRNAVHALKGTEVDFIHKGLGQQLVFNNPNAESACGCGESFNLIEESHE